MVDNANGWIDEYSVLNVFICVLIVGSLVGMDRKVLVKSGGLFIPAILAAIAGSTLLGVAAGLLIGKSPLEMITAYVLPIMGGGAGAGDLAVLGASKRMGLMGYAQISSRIGGAIILLMLHCLLLCGLTLPMPKGRGFTARLVSCIHCRNTAVMVDPASLQHFVKRTKLRIADIFVGELGAVVGLDRLDLKREHFL